MIHWKAIFKAERFQPGKASLLLRESLVLLPPQRFVHLRFASLNVVDRCFERM